MTKPSNIETARIATAEASRLLDEMKLSKTDILRHKTRATIAPYFVTVIVSSYLCTLGAYFVYGQPIADNIPMAMLMILLGYITVRIVNTVARALRNQTETLAIGINSLIELAREIGVNQGRKTIDELAEAREKGIDGKAIKAVLKDMIDKQHVAKDDNDA